MNVLQEIKNRFVPALEKYNGAESSQPAGENGMAKLLAMIRPAQAAKFGDYQANCAMPLGKIKGKPPRDVANQLVENVDLSDFSENVEVAGPGFINITLSNDWISEQLLRCLSDEKRLGIERVSQPGTYVIDFSSPNVAKPMHVGHIRSTVIGDSLAKILRFLGHTVITDNHLGDWGTQFGMIIYGYKNFVDADRYQDDPIAELSRLYRMVRLLTDYHAAVKQLPQETELLEKQGKKLDELQSTEAPQDKAANKRLKKDIKNLASKIKEQAEKLDSLKSTIDEVESNPNLQTIAGEHAEISTAVLNETAKLHDGDQTNVQLWNEFLPHCHEDIQRIYRRLKIKFDHEHGESFYHDRLPAVVADLEASGMARQSDGATCVFLEDYDTPMIVRKRDGAFLYATSDLATIKYRMETWDPDVILYVVDFRQHEHFAKLFDVARTWHYPDVQYKHVSFGTVMGDDGKPFKTRTGDTVGLEPLLDESEQRAHQVVADLDDAKPDGPEFSDEQRREIAKVVGIGALKYADLSQNRSSDYTFSFDKMVELKGNTATYLQYGFARVNGIFRRGNIDPVLLRNQAEPFQFVEDVERSLAVKLLQFEETLYDVTVDYRPNLLATYLFELTQTFFVFFDKCPVLSSEGQLKQSRLQLCDLTARTIKQGLALLGIDVVPKM